MDAGANDSIARLATVPYASLRSAKLRGVFDSSFRPSDRYSNLQPSFRRKPESGRVRRIPVCAGATNLYPHPRPRNAAPAVRAGNLILRLCYIIALTRRPTMPHPEPEPHIMPGRTNAMPAIVKALGLTLGALHFIVLAGWSGRRCGSSVQRVVRLYCQAIIAGRGRAGHQASSAPKASSSSSVAECRLSASCTPVRLLL